MGKRRGNKEGSVYKRADGRWCVQLSLEGRRLTHYAKTQREALEWLQKTREQISGGMTLKGAQSSLGEYLQAWLGSVKTSLRPNTWAQYEQIDRLHIVPYIGKIKLKDLRPDRIQGLYSAKMEEGASPTTVRLIHAVLHRALAQAVKWGIIGSNPADAVNKPKPRRVEMKVLSDNQVRTLLSVVEGTRYEALYYLAVTTGLRMGELLGLKWGDLDWNTGA